MVNVDTWHPVHTNRRVAPVSLRVMYGPSTSYSTVPYFVVSPTNCRDAFRVLTKIANSTLSPIGIGIGMTMTTFGNHSLTDEWYSLGISPFLHILYLAILVAVVYIRHLQYSREYTRVPFGERMSHDLSIHGNGIDGGTNQLGCGIAIVQRYKAGIGRGRRTWFGMTKELRLE